MSSLGNLCQNLTTLIVKKKVFLCAVGTLCVLVCAHYLLSYQQSFRCVKHTTQCSLMEYQNVQTFFHRMLECSGYISKNVRMRYLLFLKFIFWCDLQLFNTDLFLRLDFSGNSIAHQIGLLHTPLTTQGQICCMRKEANLLNCGNKKPQNKTVYLFSHFSDCHC